MEPDSFLKAAEAEGGEIAGVKISPYISDRKMTFVVWKVLPGAGQRARGVESKLKCSFCEPVRRSFEGQGWPGLLTKDLQTTGDLQTQAPPSISYTC